MISIVIPALDEAKALPATLNAIFLQGGEFEVIVVDGGSSDETVELAASYPLVRVMTAPTGRGAQMNAGAAVAGGAILLFLHADTLLPANAIEKLNRLEADENCRSGGFHQQFSGHERALRLVSWLHNKRCDVTGVFYGDQAMFVRTETFRDIGGFPVGDLEDIVLSEKLLEHGSPRFLDATVVTDSRKFEQKGPVRSLLRCLAILVCYELRLPLVGRTFFAPVR